jgi:hypothetical protein
MTLKRISCDPFYDTLTLVKEAVTCGDEPYTCPTAQTRGISLPVLLGGWDGEIRIRGRTRELINLMSSEAPWASTDVNPTFGCELQRRYHSTVGVS